MLKTFFCQDQDQDQDFYLKTKTKTCDFVLEAPRDQDLGLEDYITASSSSSSIAAVSLSLTSQRPLLSVDLSYSCNWHWLWRKYIYSQAEHTPRTSHHFVRDSVAVIILIFNSSSNNNNNIGHAIMFSATMASERNHIAGARPRRNRSPKGWAGSGSLRGAVLPPAIGYVRGLCKLSTPQ